MANFMEIRSIVSKLKMLFLPQLVYQIEMNKLLNPQKSRILQVLNILNYKDAISFLVFWILNDSALAENKSWTKLTLGNEEK